MDTESPAPYDGPTSGPPVDNVDPEKIAQAEADVAAAIERGPLSGPPVDQLDPQHEADVENARRRQAAAHVDVRSAGSEPTYESHSS